MKLIILNDYDQASEWAAKYIRNKILLFKPGPDRYFTLGLPTGSTPLGCYKKLIEYYKNGEVSFQYVKTFNMDEYVESENTHILDGNAADLQAECETFEEKIKAAGGIQLFVGGIGPDGHIAFNEPGSSLVSRTRVKTLAKDTIMANARFFDGDLSKVPTMALTVGVGTVMDAKEVMILITGAHKAFALYKAIEEGVNHMWTVSAFQQHPQTVFVCDEDATLELRVKTVKYFKAFFEYKEDGGRFPNPPSYSVATTLPSYDEAERSKEEAAIPLVTGRVTEDDFVARDDFEDADQLRIGNDGIFMLTFFMAFLFNWIGFFLSFCLTTSAAGRYGAISGFGLSLIKWVLIVRFSTYFPGYFDGQYWLWWVFLALGFMLFIRGFVNYSRVRKLADPTYATLPRTRVLFIY
ncbi:Glucosamine-6-phosphate isomerase 1 [Collichthys lucidus]|uniref:Glucosamine-6-phosphate deaminase 1 n=1 Tax=Collichthys lucidus TaxID=240159 RepID=A0A4U5UDB7_COLLU|nr:Glucosamine-6-phosphate isomerase 1 [Collichthys lucidus]